LISFALRSQGRREKALICVLFVFLLDFKEKCNGHPIWSKHKCAEMTRPSSLHKRVEGEIWSDPFGNKGQVFVYSSKEKTSFFERSKFVNKKPGKITNLAEHKW
jgi:hypothetical protein